MGGISSGVVAGEDFDEAADADADADEDDAVLLSGDSVRFAAVVTMSHAGSFFSST
jgi:hypothetical protein